MADQSRRSSRTSMRSKPLGQLLTENGDATTDQVAEAVRAQEEQGGMLGAILQRMGACTPDAIGHALSKQVQVTDIQCEDIDDASAAVKMVPREFCQKEKLCPFEKLGNLLCVVMGNPLNRKAISDIEGMSRMKVKAFKAPWPKISELIDRSYDSAQAAASAPAKPRQSVEDLSFELEPEPPQTRSPGPVAPPKAASKPVPPTVLAPAEEDESLPEDDDIIIPPSQPAGSEDEPDGSTGILEIPMEHIRLPSHAEIPRPNFASPPVQPTIKGLDALDFRSGELVDVAKRKGAPASPAPAKKAAPKVAKVNVDLDRFDLTSATETIDTVERPETETMEEIQYGSMDPEERKPNGILVALKIVPDGYFYSGNSPKNAPRSDDLMDIIEALPVAEVVAESIADFERKSSGGQTVPGGETSSVIALSGTAMAGKSRVDLQRAPATPMAAIRLGEGEFVKLTLTQVEDELGEWEWSFASTGPVAVDTFED